ncbi:benzoate/H(+) symporter BenE family transporter, partial [Streptomyces galilaeus]
LSYYYKIPILIAWSTTGAALLITSAQGYSLNQAVGAFMFSALLMFISGITGWFEKVMQRIPSQIACAMLAGVLVTFGIDVFNFMAK